MKPLALFLTLICGLAFGCAGCQDPPPPHPMTQPLGQLPEQGQLPKEVVEEAAATHAGSFTGDGGVRPGAAPSSANQGVVLGPVRAEKVPPHVSPEAGDAGIGLRAVIEERIAAGGTLTLHDAPSERLIDDAPRPDLARKGVRFVIKGTLRLGKDTGEALVLLRAIDTGNGNVVEFTSARAGEPAAAARDAADRLVSKLAARIAGS